MLRKRARSIQKDQPMGQLASDVGSETHLQSHAAGQKQKTHSFFNVPGLFVGFTPKGASDCDSVRSPTSPLDFKLFFNLGRSSFRFPKSSDQKSWDCNNKVGLRIVDSLDDDGGGGGDDNNRNLGGKVASSSNSKNILFGPQVRTKNPDSPTHHANLRETPRSLPKNYSMFHHTLTKASNLQKGKSDVLFEIGEDGFESDPLVKIQSFSLDSNRLGAPIHGLGRRRPVPANGIIARSPSPPGMTVEGCVGREEGCRDEKLASIPVPIGSSSEFICSLSASEIELSEDYTCVISHGPNPKTTHIFGDCILECHTPTGGLNSGKKREGLEIEVSNGNKTSAETSPPYPSSNFLSFCYFCSKKLEEGKDIYMYRGEKAFCSLDCRWEEILIEEGKEDSVIDEAPRESPDGKEICENSMFLAI